MASTPPSPPLVWVTQGKTQHAAHLLETKGEECLIRWNSNNEQALVMKQDVARSLTPRRRRRPLREGPLTSNGDSDGITMTIEQNWASLGGNGKRKTPPQGEETDQCDDEVQVLLTIMPPTPKRPKQKVSNKSQPVMSYIEASRVSTSPLPSNAIQPDESSAAFLRQEKQKVVPDIGSLAQASDSAKDEDQKPASEQTYTFQSSAYVQNLAEICHTILNDARWRVEGAAQKRLLAWENGEDLSAVLMLSKLFEPPRRQCVTECRCLLCRDKEGAQGSTENEEKDNVATFSTEHDDTSSVPQLSEPEIDEETARAIHLYCRLYYRKGPWFRLDDIFTRYYAPKRQRALPTKSEASAESENAEQEDSDAALKERKNSFFECSSSSHFKTSDSVSSQSTRADIIGQNILQEHLSSFALMLRDVDYLHEIGLIRSFRDEEECGKVVGAVTPDGSGVILRAQERRVIVAKLGGRGKKDKNRRSTEADTPGTQPPLVARENIIWKQMCQQKSISLTLLSNGKNAKTLLPVCRHVDDALLEKLATTIVLASSMLDYVPAPILRSVISDVKARILGLWQPACRSFSMCLKLREAPLLTLRRCARLYLCATSGPGDMRGDGTNAWRSLGDFDVASIPPGIPLPTVIQPPGSHSWHRVVHPALSHRFGITSSAFIDAYQFVDCKHVNGSNGDMTFLRPFMPGKLPKCGDDGQLMSPTLQVQVFETADGFRMWELCIEVRAYVDYYLELKELLAYNARRRAREQDVSENHKPGKSNGGSNTGEEEAIENTEEDPTLLLTFEYIVSLDYLGLLAVKGRKSMINKLVVLSGAACDVDDVCENVEHTISELEAFIAGKKKRTAKDDTVEGELSLSERIVVILSVIILHLLIVRNHVIKPEELASKQARPWLRHLCWEGILAYALWDCVPLLERRGFYDLSCSCLEVLLFGKIQNRDNVVVASEMEDQSHHFEKTFLSELLMSRRARGKAHERLMIDYVHLLRWKIKSDSASSDEGSNEARGTRSKQTRKKDVSVEVSPQDAVRRVCSRVVGAVARAGSIPFSAVRSLARRIKAPLATSLKLPCPEVDALGIRLNNRNDAATNEGEKKSEKIKGYIDWIPPTDQAVANAMAGEETLAGKRCSYVGFEENAAGKADMTSLNVEELAMQYYASGRLPASETADDELAGGGWVGWHDEGGHVRALFRVICARPILGMDSGCGKESVSLLDYIERLTIHLTPYQGAPFDLHVAHWESASEALSTEGADESHHGMVVRSFYQRRRIQIDKFLSKLERLTGQELSDLVYDSVVCRLGERRLQDTMLARDLQQVRALSMLAVGFGGHMLSAMFRCFIFDYRHYSGGLPDLLLVRALMTCNEEGGQQKSLVDLGGWVGEEFSVESQMEKESIFRLRLLIDKDDEFLGCSKVGDSGGQPSGRWRRGAQRQPNQNDVAKEADELCLKTLPPRLVLRHNDRDVQVQCLFVEVKSQNDRLDGRQEDWLNVLDRVGNARVCKFESGKKKSTKIVSSASAK